MKYPMMTKINQEGFALMLGLLVLTIVGIVAGGGFYVYQAQKDAGQSLNKTSSTNNSTPDTPQKASPDPAKNNSTQKPVEDKNPGFFVITQWDVAVRIGSTTHSDKLTYRVAKDEYGDDTAYFLLTEEVSKNCREVGFALHRKTTPENSKYVKIGQAHYAPSSAPLSFCDKYTDEDKAVSLLNELSDSIAKFDYEFKPAN